MIQTCREHGWAGELVLGPGGGCPMCKAIAESKQQEEPLERFRKFFKEHPELEPIYRWTNEQE